MAVNGTGILSKQVRAIPVHHAILTQCKQQLLCSNDHTVRSHYYDHQLIAIVTAVCSRDSS